MPHTPGLATVVLLGEDEVEVQLDPGALYLAGPFAGNVVVLVRTSPVLPPKAVVQALKLAVGSDPEKLAPMAYEPFNDGSIEITYHSPTAVTQNPAPTRVEVFWVDGEETALGSLALSPAAD